MSAAIRDIEFWLPEKVVTNADLAIENPEWNVEAVADKTGIQERRITANGECASDLGFEAAKKIFSRGRIGPSDIDYVILCTQSPDYFLPTTACLLQERLGIPDSAGALDINLGCSGYIYGLGLAKGLIASHQVKNVLLITADTYSKFISPGDRSVRMLFGDAGAATVISPSDNGPSQARRRSANLHANRVSGRRSYAITRSSSHNVADQATLNLLLYQLNINPRVSG